MLCHLKLHEKRDFYPPKKQNKETFKGWVKVTFFPKPICKT